MAFREAFSSFLHSTNKPRGHREEEEEEEGALRLLGSLREHRTKCAP